jgi:hypothetical protein
MFVGIVRVGLERFLGVEVALMLPVMNMHSYKQVMQAPDESAFQLVHGGCVAVPRDAD